MHRISKEYKTCPECEEKILDRSVPVRCHHKYHPDCITKILERKGRQYCCFCGDIIAENNDLVPYDTIGFGFLDDDNDENEESDVISESDLPDFF